LPAVGTLTALSRRPFKAQTEAQTAPLRFAEGRCDTQPVPALDYLPQSTGARNPCSTGWLSQANSVSRKPLAPGIQRRRAKRICDRMKR
jgi:hypothetical protein